MTCLAAAALGTLLSAGAARAIESSSSRYTNLSGGGGETRAAAGAPKQLPATKTNRPASKQEAPISVKITPAASASSPPRRSREAWLAAIGLGLAAAYVLRRRDRARLRANDESLALAAHELQSPLAAIESYLDLMASEAPAATQESRRWLEDISLMRNTTTHLRRTITDILDMTRVEDGRVKLSAREVDTRTVIAASVAAYAPHAASRGVILNAVAPAGLAAALADPDRLRQVLDNLIGNAIKYTPSGRGVSVASSQTAQRVIFEVRDEGVGVPEDKRARLFGKFQRLGPALDGTEGTGLGLYLSQRLVAAMGGRLEHEPRAGGGSVFRVTIPRA